MITNHLRWHLKKTARSVVAYGSSWTGLQRAFNPSKDMPRIRVLTYHSFLGIPRDPFSISLDVFERQMSLLAKQELAVSLSDLTALIQGNKKFTGDRILITVDDGF